ncbi:DnaJ C-terminal domain-containing protein [Methylobacterium sp. J-070]|uniref:DnaJ C-terminal domain-containing protein n=1 Tax=Methylobacterium sp. J-070 TaxID=2836650 RepID=UPI001FBADF99|nr:J domain-containing protein [Methylobacterium sp. J-070]MCJ2049178.1 J domain-containing protein [Methylobacterium sp. J-070]
MSDDPYAILGVKSDASPEQIRKTYRKLARKLHPDLNPGNTEAEEQFKNVSRAYDLLNDPEKRARFDRGEIDISGVERPRQRYYRDFTGPSADHAYASDAGFADFDTDDILSEIFGRRGRSNFRRRGADVRYHLDLDFLDAVNGTTRPVTLPDGATLDVRIPAGTREGQTLRLRGKGEPGAGGAPPGDALIEIGVRPHSVFRRKGDDIHFEQGVPLHEAVLGGRITVSTPAGPVTVTIPKWSNSGTVLRLKGKGVQRSDGTAGDGYVKLLIKLPDKPDPELERAIAAWHRNL